MATDESKGKLLDDLLFQLKGLDWVVGDLKAGVLLPHELSHQLVRVIDAYNDYRKVSA